MSIPAWRFQPPPPHPPTPEVPPCQQSVPDHLSQNLEFWIRDGTVCGGVAQTAKAAAGGLLQDCGTHITVIFGTEQAIGPFFLCDCPSTSF